MTTIAVLEKLPLDVSWTVHVQHATPATSHAKVAIVTPSKDSNAHTNVYYTEDDLVKDYDESTEVYNNYNAMINVNGFEDKPVQVIEYPASGSSSSSVSSVSSKGGSLSESPTAPIVKAVEDNLDALALYVVPTSDVKKEDVISLANALYDDRGGAVMYQTSNKDDMHAVSSAINAHQQTGSNGNFFGIYEDRPLYPVAQLAAFLSMNIPYDAMKVSNLSDFQYTDLSIDQTKDVLNSGFNLIENKADMAMVSTGKVTNGDYLDNFVDVKYVIDQMTYTLQRYMNTHNDIYNQQAIDGLKTSVQSEATNLYKQNVFKTQPVVSGPNYGQVNIEDVNNRTYKGLTVSGTLFDTIEKFHGTINITE